VRARDHHRVFALNKMIPHEFGQRTNVEPFVQRSLDLRVAAFHRVADDDQIGVMVEIRFTIPAEDADAMRDSRNVDIGG
jgi:hypothetical protein